MATSGEDLRDDVLQGFSFTVEAFEAGPLLNQTRMRGAEGAESSGEAFFGRIAILTDELNTMLKVEDVGH